MNGKKYYGHPRFYELSKMEAQLHSDKNHDYALGGDPLGNFKREAAILSLYPNLDHSDPAVVALLNMMKQLDAALWMLSNKHNPIIEGPVQRLADVSVYAKLAMILLEE